jgi:acyl carrier protein
MSNTIRTVADVASRHTSQDKVAGLKNPDVELKSLGLDSIELVAFLIDLEKTFRIKFPNEMIETSTFRTLRTVAQAVEAARERSV